MIDAVKNNNTVLVQTVDTDIIIILEKLPDILLMSPSADIWITLGHGKNIRTVHVNRLTETVGLHRCPALMMLHSLS